MNFIGLRIHGNKQGIIHERNNMRRITLMIDGPFCYPCIERLIKKLKAMNGVIDVKLNVVAGLLVVYSNEDIEIKKLQEVIEESDFKFLRRVM